MKKQAAPEPTRAVLPLSIIIPTLNEAERLPGLLDRLQQQTQPAQQILVVDGGSDDRTVELAAQRPGVRVIKTSASIAGQRNSGAAQASQPWLLFLDADVYPEPDFLARAWQELQSRQLQLASCWSRPYRSIPRIQLFFRCLNTIFWLTQRWCPSGGGMALWVTQPVFAASGGFNPEMRFEDIELIRRLSRHARYGLLRTKLAVADRRFHQDGYWRTVGRYLLLGALFSLGWWRLANRIEYRFNHYRPKTTPSPKR